MNQDHTAEGPTREVARMVRLSDAPTIGRVLAALASKDQAGLKASDG